MKNFRKPAIPNNWNRNEFKTKPSSAESKNEPETNQEERTTEDLKSRLNWDELPLFLTVEDIQRLLRVSKNTAYAIVRSGELRAKMVGRQYRIPRSAIMKYAEQN